MTARRLEAVTATLDCEKVIMENILKEIANHYSTLDCVFAVVQAGSRTSCQSDEMSDYDIYVYSDMEIPVEFRTQLAKLYTDDCEINNQYFETGDEWVLKDGNTLDFMFRSVSWITGCIENTYTKHYASNGYTTCFLHNVATSKILYDKNGWFKGLQDKITGGYPKELRDNIIKRNMMLLKDKKSASYLEQIKLAVKRNDPVSINHRISAFLASYFDVLFAANEIFHPGEKRLIKYAKQHCKSLPRYFEDDLMQLFKAVDDDKITILDNMVERLRAILP